MVNNYLMSTCSYQVLSYVMTMNLLNKLKIQEVKRRKVRLKRILHEKAAQRQSVKLTKS